MSNKALTKGGGIYKITNPRGQVYIGATKNFRNRVANYRHLWCKGSRKIYKSLLDFGFENHIIELVHPLPKDISIEDKGAIESLFISQYKDLGFDLLNISSGGKRKFTHDSESKRLISEWKIGKPLSESHRRNIGTGQKGRVFTEETRRKMSESAKKKIITAQHRANLSKAIKARPPMSQEVKDKMSEAAKRRYQNPEYKARAVKHLEKLWKMDRRRKSR